MKKILAAFCFSAILLSSCSKDEEPNEFAGKQFDFISFSEDAVVSNQTSTAISFYATDFDTDKNSWSITLADDSEVEIPVTIQAIEKATFGFYDGTPTRVSIYKADLRTSTPLPVGTYHISITNKNTAQTYIDYFMVVKNNAISEVTTKNVAPDLSCIQNTSKYLITPGNTVYIKTVRISEVSGVRVQKKDESESYGLNYTIENGQVAFSLPNSSTTGYYYIILEHNHLASNIAYYKYALPVGKEQLPEIKSIDKAVYGANDVIIITGTNLKYTIDPSLIPAKAYFNPHVWSGLSFSDASGIGNLWEVYGDFTVNEAGTEIRCAVSKAPFRSYNDRNDFDGSIAVYNGAYTSNKVTISIVR